LSNCKGINFCSNCFNFRIEISQSIPQTILIFFLAARRLLMKTNEWIGKSIAGRYQIEGLMGQGGMSAVYKANDPNLKRVVAVKLIHEHLSSDPGFVGRFEEEAAAIAQLRHPNIVQVFDFDVEEGTYYMVMEFIPGETLQQQLKRLNEVGRSMEIEDVVGYLIDICEASDYAHDRGLIHRDIKPANIMLSVQKQAILMDFGIAKIIGGQQHTATGAVVGTAQYMSPEQIKGEQLDRRSDIYSLGVTLFEMVSGHPPYEADSAMTLMMMHINDPVPDLKQLNPNIPPTLVSVINKALAKTRDDRYQTAGEMAAALRGVLGQPSDAPSAAAAAVLSDATVIEEALPSTEESETAAPSPPDATVVEAAVVAGAASQAAQQAVLPDVQQTTAEPATQPPPAPPTTPPPPTAEAAGSDGIFGIKPLYLIIGGVVLIAIILAVVFGSSLFGGGGDDGLPVAVASPTDIEIVEVTPSPTTIPTDTPTLAPPTETFTPTVSPTITLTPTQTVPPGIPYVRINDITIDDQSRYVVEYETFEYVEEISSSTLHVHFFFDTVPPEQAGSPGSGPWILYGGPRPFTGYTVFAKPPEATEMCALTANPDHSVQMGSGMCFLLPEPAE
jgi:serine/threonine protein kinase